MYCNKHHSTLAYFHFSSTTYISILITFPFLTCPSSFFSSFSSFPPASFELFLLLFFLFSSNLFSSNLFSSHHIFFLFSITIRPLVQSHHRWRHCTFLKSSSPKSVKTVRFRSVPFYCFCVHFESSSECGHSYFYSYFYSHAYSCFCLYSTSTPISVSRRAGFRPFLTRSGRPGFNRQYLRSGDSMNIEWLYILTTTILEYIGENRMGYEWIIKTEKCIQRCG